MRISLEKNEIALYVQRQLGNWFPDGETYYGEPLRASADSALTRVEVCFSQIRRKYFCESGQVTFDHLHSDHWAMFLYLLSNELYRRGSERLATKVFYLNKALNGLDAFYSVQLPEVFMFVHPVGTVLGNAAYADYFIAYQNCTVRSDELDNYPRFGEGVILYAGSRVIGGCEIGDNCVLAANSFLVNTNIPANTLVTGQYPNHELRSNKRSAYEREFAEL